MKVEPVHVDECNGVFGEGAIDVGLVRSLDLGTYGIGDEGVGNPGCEKAALRL